MHFISLFFILKNFVLSYLMYWLLWFCVVLLALLCLIGDCFWWKVKLSIQLPVNRSKIRIPKPPSLIGNDNNQQSTSEYFISFGIAGINSWLDLGLEVVCRSVESFSCSKLFCYVVTNKSNLNCLRLSFYDLW